MARLNRLKIRGTEAFYHVMSRTVGQEFLLKNDEKDKFIEILKNLSGLFFVKVIGFSIMSNHFHLLIKMETGNEYSDDEVLTRLKNYYGRNFILSDSEICRFKEKFGDISEFIKLLKQKFSVWYNRKNSRKGHFWSDRFKSVLIENGNSLFSCLAYIDLNSIRANLVEHPEEYKWSSIGCRVNRCDNEDYLSLDGIPNISDLNFLNEYLKYLYLAGDIPGLRSQNNINFKNTYSILLRPGIFRSKMSTFSDSIALGSYQFIKNTYITFGSKILTKKNKEVYKTEFSNHLYSVRRKYEAQSSNIL